MRKVLNIFTSSGSNLHLLKDARYSVSNNWVECAVRPLLRPNVRTPLYLGSDEGAEIAAVYHSMISIGKLQGWSAWDYLGKFFTGFFNVCRDFLSLAPQNINLAVCQELKINRI